MNLGIFSSIRFQLTLWYVALFAAALAIFSFYLFFSLRTSIYHQFDESLLRTARAAASYFTEFTERDDPIRGAQETVKDVRVGQAAFAIFRGAELLGATDNRNWTRILAKFSSTQCQTDPITGERVVMVLSPIGGIEYRIIASESLSAVYHQFAAIEQSLIVGLPLLVVLAIAGGVLLSKRGLRSVSEVCEQAEQISARNLDVRLPVTHANGEVGRLSLAFNSLLVRLENSFRVMRSFMADASHELKTPLSVMQGEIDVALSRRRTEEEYRESLSVLRDQARRMSRIVTDLLALSRADAGQSELATEELYLNDLLQESVRAAQGLAARKNIGLSVQGGDNDITFTGNEELLRRMIFNLLDNAIQYTPEDGSVKVDLKCEDGKVLLSVADTGIGIPQEYWDRVFDRFFRVDSSRNRAHGGGAGLGLSIVKLAADSHKGTVRLLSAPGIGSTFTVELPGT
jgi:heavy metal sensor kinase